MTAPEHKKNQHSIHEPKKEAKKEPLGVEKRKPKEYKPKLTPKEEKKELKEQHSEPKPNIKKEPKVIPPQPQALNIPGTGSRNKNLNMKGDMGKNASSFSYQPSKALEKLSSVTQKMKVEKPAKGVNESNGKCHPINSICIELSMFNKLLESTELRHKDRQQKRKKNNNLYSKNQTETSVKDLHASIPKVVEEEKEEFVSKIPLSNVTNSNPESSNDPGSTKEGERSHRSYLRHTKTSRMKRYIFYK